jgi:hypothetical protein
MTTSFHEDERIRPMKLIYPARNTKTTFNNTKTNTNVSFVPFCNLLTSAMTLISK